MNESHPHWLQTRLAGFYGFYFAATGVLLPYWSPYLQSLGFGPAQIGELLALTLASKLIAPYLWGWLADTSGRRMLVVRLACAAAGLSFAGVYLLDATFLNLAIIMLAYSFFWHAALPQFETVTLGHLGTQTHRYSGIRLWGSLGFIVTAVGVGFMLEAVSIAWLPVLILLLFAGLFANSLIIPEPPQQKRKTKTDSISQIIRQPQVIAFFLVCFLMQASHGPFYAFFTIYAADLGYSGGLVGALWALGVLAEVIVFLLMSPLLLRFGVRQLMLFTLLITALRWLLTGFAADVLVILIGAQLLHGFSFGMYHALAINLIHRFFTGTTQGRGQALLGSVGFGLGGSLGSLGSGYLWADFSPAVSYLCAAGLCLLSGLIAWRWLTLTEANP